MAASMTYCRKRFFFLLSSKRQSLICYFNRRYYRKLTPRSYEIEVNGSKKMYLEVGSLAKFADGAVVAKFGNTAVLVAISSRTEVGANTQFLPLTVDYRQKYAAAGRIPLNHLRRELGPTNKEILTSRVIDRSLRTRFPKDYFNETQITCNMLSIDGINDPDVLSINAASAALCVSDIPWNGPVGAVRVGFINKNNSNGQSFIINPTRKEQSQSDLNLVIASDVDKNVVMLEGEANNIPYEVFKAAVNYGAGTAADIANQLKVLNKDSPTKRLYTKPTELSQELMADVEREGYSSVQEILNTFSHDKVSRDKSLQKARYQIISDLSNKYNTKEEVQDIHTAINYLVKNLIKEQIITKRIRCDGRTMNDVRQISCKVDLYPPLHGSSLFQRGQTQVMSTVTFDSLQATMKTDPISVLTGEMKEKNFMLHYEFPAYATNELKAPGIKNRRELGHGTLAEKGLRAILPDDFPFCIRLTCEVLESNGSSSMASICGGSLALMDAGVNIKEPAAGVAIGLVTKETEDDDKYHLLADISGIEDYFGEMDMKIGGTVSGLTAIQMDLKNSGIPVYLICDAVDLAKKKITFIIGLMQKLSKLEAPRNTMKMSRPVLEKVTVPPVKMGSFLGTGGINLKKLRSETGVTVTNVDENTFEIFAPNQEAMDEAMEMVKTFLETKKEPELEFNAVYEANITEIKEYGVMIQIHPAMNPVLLKNSQLDHRQISHPSVLGFKVGQKILVKYFGRDPVTGKMRLSRKVISAPVSRSYKFMKE